MFPRQLSKVYPFNVVISVYTLNMWNISYGIYTSCTSFGALSKYLSLQLLLLGFLYAFPFKMKLVFYVNDTWKLGINWKELYNTNSHSFATDPCQLVERNNIMWEFCERVTNRSIAFKYFIITATADKLKLALALAFPPTPILSTWYTWVYRFIFTFRSNHHPYRHTLLQIHVTWEKSRFSFQTWYTYTACIPPWVMEMVRRTGKSLIVIYMNYMLEAACCNF